jgi:tetratricopeptide (TPR) repeat protein
MQPGQVIADRFSVERLANTGGMGAVYRALDRVTGEDVALKVLHGCSAQAAALFAREAEVLAALCHPGIVKYVAHGHTEDGALWLSMEWLEGEDLEGRIQRAPLSVGETLSLGRRAAEALGAAHVAGIVHRDIKPSNLIIVGQDIAQTKIVDFGIARSRQATRPATRTGALLGTPGYMAPEQTLGAKDLDETADVFALGCVLYECLTGTAAFDGEHVMVVLAKILLGETPRVRSHRPEVPEALDALIARMMSKEPSRRPRDGALVALEIAAIDGARGPHVRVSVPSIDDPERSSQLPRQGASEDPSPMRRARLFAPEPSPLLGAVPRFVGRDREIESLEAFYGECVWSPCARVALVTGPPGIGKSALCRRFLERIKASGQPVEVWLSEGSPTREGSPFGLFARAIRRAAGIEGGDPLDVRKRKLERRIALRVPEADVERVTGFVGQMVGIPSAAGPDLAFSAALQDARLMGAQIRRAIEDWLAAECASQPVVIALEDLEWGDRSSAALIAAALRHLRDSPLLVLATSKSEARALFPQLFPERATKEVRLGELPRAECERIAREALEPLGRAGAPERVARIVELARGNPLHLEELIRAAADASDPARVLSVSSPRAALAASISTLEGEAQRVLRAASVFDDAFSAAGLSSVLKDTIISADESGMLACRHWLSVLIERELVVRRGGRTVAEPDALAFRHPLLRELVDETLPKGERVTFHRRVGEWLERMGDGEPGALARHFELGGEPARAAGWCAVAAERSLEGDDFAGILAWADRGIALGASGQLLGTLRLLGAEAYRWQGDHEGALAAAQQAMRELPAGSAHWYFAVGQAALVSGNIGDHERLLEVFHELCAAAVPPLSAPHVIALSRVALQLLQAGLHEVAELAFDALMSVDDDVIRRDPEVSASIHRARAFQGRYAGDPAASLVSFAAAAEAFEQVGDLLNACVQQVNVGWVNIELGDYAEAERNLRAALLRADRLGLTGLTAFARHNLGLALARLGQLYEARLVETQALEVYKQQGDRRLEGGSRIYLALILTLEGDLAEAARQAEEAVEIVAMHPPVRACALAVLGQVWMLEGRAADALRAGEEAMRLLEDLGGIDEGEALVRLVHAAALGQAGFPQIARVAIAAARDRLLARAEKITSPALRASFLERVPENARTLMLARQWAGSVAPGPGLPGPAA